MQTIVFELEHKLPRVMQDIGVKTVWDCRKQYSSVTSMLKPCPLWSGLYRIVWIGSLYSSRLFDEKGSFCGYWSYGEKTRNFSSIHKKKLFHQS